MLQETGYKKFKGLPIVLEGRYQLEHRCTLYGNVIKKQRKGSTLHSMAVMDFLIEQRSHSLSASPTGTENNSNPFSGPRFDTQCIGRLENGFPWTLERHYIHSHVNETHKMEVINMFKEIKLTTIESILQINWLNIDEKKFLADKVFTLDIFALYSDRDSSETKENLSTIYD
ncbi:unnamed protein product, partial [Schistosoma turkestanicum]